MKAFALLVLFALLSSSLCVEGKVCKSRMPLEPCGYGRFECEPSFWKTWQGFDYIFPIPPKNVPGGNIKTEGESSVDFNIVVP